jgi:hypothetical protein
VNTSREEAGSSNGQFDQYASEIFRAIELYGESKESSLSSRSSAHPSERSLITDNLLPSAPLGHQIFNHQGRIRQSKEDGKESKPEHNQNFL